MGYDTIHETVTDIAILKMVNVQEMHSDSGRSIF